MKAKKQIDEILAFILVLDIENLESKLDVSIWIEIFYQPKFK